MVSRPAPEPSASDRLRKVEAAILDLEYGEVLVVVHQGQITDLKTTRKERF
ncbi:MAG: YezD family protein [Phaeospirillum sp.]|nr:YezD family protein [Phaeospirillum sp.]